MVQRDLALDRAQARPWRQQICDDYAAAVAVERDPTRLWHLSERRIECAILSSVTGVLDEMDRYDEGVVSAADLAKLLKASRKRLNPALSLLDESSHPELEHSVVALVARRIRWLDGRVQGQWFRARQVTDRETTYKAGQDLQTAVKQQRIALEHVDDALVLSVEGLAWVSIMARLEELDGGAQGAKQTFQAMTGWAPGYLNE